MKYIYSAAALLAATVVAEKRDLCSEGSVDDGGNWYCQKVQAITYTGVGGSGSYNKISAMNPDGTCSSSPFGYSGSMSPLDEEVSLHFRGPIALKQFAVYTAGSSSSKKSRRGAHARRHAHNHAHAHGQQHQARDAAVGDMVTATIDGQVVTWANDYSGEATSSAAASSATPSTTSSASSVDLNVKVVGGPSVAATSTISSTPQSTDSSSSDSSPSVAGSWGRQAYYSASEGKTDGLVFLNHNGGTGSGVFDYTFGNSLSYASADGTSGASSPQVLESTTLPSTEEVVVMSDSICNNNDCGTVRPGTVAYHGFDGPAKAFFFEFAMPDTGETTADQYSPINMPAIWLLNAQIPRTLQYGAADCSCWTSGCGEFDIFEVLAPGDKRMKSTLHGNIAGGSSDYFERPTGNSIKGALVLYNDNIHIKLLDDTVDFGTSMSADTINEIVSSTLKQTSTVSLFTLAGAAGG